MCAIDGPVLLALDLQLAPLDPLGSAHSDPNRISSDLLAEATGPFGEIALLDPRRQRAGHRGAPDCDRSPVGGS